MPPHPARPTTSPRRIGVVGGVGPAAGLDLVHKIIASTRAERDQDHLPVALLSFPGQIPDRTAFLLGQADENPGHALADVARALVDAGAEVVGVPCNTAHVPAIFDLVRDGVAGRADLVHMVEEVGAEVARQFPAARTLGVLSTTGTLASEVYPRTLEPLGYRVLQVPPDVQDRHVQPAIYDWAYGIKSTPAPSAEAVAGLTAAAGSLAERGADLVVLACTEIPLALREPTVRGVPCLDPTLVLARALVRRSAPGRLVPSPAPPVAAR